MIQITFPSPPVPTGKARALTKAEKEYRRGYVDGFQALLLAMQAHLAELERWQASTRVEPPKR